ncbi:F-box domain-containing protein [Colletotrichum tofieldiae]|uniref:F-box domain-containing protein n=1 Tax=Colletotrichum tofieldiae TaxID=708197 RepID=A0A166NSV4_9PEZI|nr:F-box domain-containing protein [Colletotrichum tofieldiae]GKT62191.1 F-box domain-containing protein [Colletotrichum tofieldiae]GKT69761.1 F-box domain-containing protein [Colletotrichum tofieldiae]GKT92774.1 F-box domain-containing protein [Colletotrichum tofieldiae]
MQRKRHHPPAGAGEPLFVSKRACLITSQQNEANSKTESKIIFADDDILSSLSDELLLRILSFLPTSNLLGIAPVSRRFYRLSSDSQLWRTLYYHRFVLPRALRIPGFRDGSARESTRIHYSARRTVWADGGWGRRGGSGQFVDWKRQYRLRHNWASGKASVEELKVGEASSAFSESRKTLAKVVEGIAITADSVSGLRAWDLKTREPIAQIGLGEGLGETTPTCLAVDDQVFENKKLDVLVGFLDGSFGAWRLDLEDGGFLRRYMHEKSSNGRLVEIAYRHPFVLTATESVLISLYNFERPASTGRSVFPRQQSEAVTPEESETDAGSESATLQESESDTEEFPFLKARKKRKSPQVAISLPAPILLTSLKSHTSRAPLALSIRQMASYVIASIAYTFSTLEGWSIGIQDLQIPRQGAGGLTSSSVVSTRLAFTEPVKASGSVSSTPSVDVQRPHASPQSSDGPRTLCYNHPYLLAAMADNTLILHVCTSNATKLSVSGGIRLWGHTSGISDAEITARGKAVSVSCRGEEIRVWELEGRVSGKSIEIRPSSAANEPEVAPARWDDRRNWVGFDDEMVIVLKETKDGRESLVVYDFS